MPMTIAASELRVSAITAIAAATASQMRGDAESVDGTTIEMKTDAAIALRKASTRGVMATFDMIQTPPRRVASVTSAISMTAMVAEMSSTMTPRSDGAAGECPGNDVPTRRKRGGAKHGDGSGRNPR